MSSYSPPTSITDNKKTCRSGEARAGTIADSLYPEINFQNTMHLSFFHAGVGRDLDLVSSLGYNPTPYDIPSLYLDSTAFATSIRTIIFSPGYADGSVKNTIFSAGDRIAQFLNTGSGNDTIQLSINGMFAASIGSYLGLPDLSRYQNRQIRV